MWKKNKDTGEYERVCGGCHGTGRQAMPRQGRFGCGCPYSESSVKVEHPANETHHNNVSHYLERCDACGRIWLVYEDNSDDSLDIPAPVFLGLEVPADGWREPDLRK